MSFTLRMRSQIKSHMWIVGLFWMMSSLYESQFEDYLNSRQ